MSAQNVSCLASYNNINVQLWNLFLFSSFIGLNIQKSKKHYIKIVIEVTKTIWAWNVCFGMFYTGSDVMIIIGAWGQQPLHK